MSHCHVSMDQPHTSTGNRLCVTIGGGAVSVCSTLDSDNTSTVTEPTR